MDSRSLQAQQWLMDKKIEFYQPLLKIHKAFYEVRNKIFASRKTNQVFEA